MEEDVAKMEAGETKEEGELPVEAAVEEVMVGVGDADEAERSDCACLAHFLAAALVCLPHEHGLLTEGVKNDPCRHFLIGAITAKMSLFDGFWPLPLNTGCLSARFMS